MKISLRKSKRRLATLWFIGGGIVFFIVLAQVIRGIYGPDYTEALGWLLPTIMPTLSLIIGAVIADVAAKDGSQRTVDRFTYRLTFSISLFYLLVVLLTIIVQPVTPIPALDLMKQSHLWLGPFQGLVGASLGVFFTRSE